MSDAIRGLPPATDELGAPEGPTRADVAAHSRRAAQAQRAAALAAYRSSHDLPESMSDATVWALCFIEQVGQGGATALDSREGRRA